MKDQLPVVRTTECEKNIYLPYELPNEKEQLHVARAPEYERKITCHKSSRMIKNYYLSQELPNMNVHLPVVRATECERTFTYRKSSRM